MPLGPESVLPDGTKKQQTLNYIFRKIDDTIKCTEGNTVKVQNSRFGWQTSEDIQKRYLPEIQLKYYAAGWLCVEWTAFPGWVNTEGLVLTNDEVYMNKLANERLAREHKQWYDSLTFWEWLVYLFKGKVK